MAWGQLGCLTSSLSRVWQQSGRGAHAPAEEEHAPEGAAALQAPEREDQQLRQRALPGPGPQHAGTGTRIMASVWSSSWAVS